MSTELKYMPIFRGRAQELGALKTFNFGNRIYPLIEIIKEFDRNPSEPEQENATYAKPKKRKDFAEVYLFHISRINAKKIFVDLPVHLKTANNTKKETRDFHLEIITDRKTRTDYIKKLVYPNSRIIPVISTYYHVENELNTIVSQANDLRGTFNTLSFRTFPDSFSNDIKQIELVFRKGDFLIMDWGNQELDFEFKDGDQQDIIDRLKTFQGTVIIHSNPIPNDLTYKSLEHGEIINKIDNRLLDKYKSLGGICFSDYAGTKKNEITDGGGTSPGFFYYDATENEFYGFKGKKSIDDKVGLEEFKQTIVPDIISSAATQRMKEHFLKFLGPDNKGWRMIKKIDSDYNCSGESATVFKRIGIEHYLHCMKSRIENGDFD